MTPRVKVRYRDGFDREGESGPERKCSTCGDWWPLSFYGKAPACRLGRNFRCAGCRNRQRNANAGKGELPPVLQIRAHYERRGLRGADLRRALEKHARILSACDPQTANWLRSERVRGAA